MYLRTRSMKFNNDKKQVMVANGNGNGDGNGNACLVPQWCLETRLEKVWCTISINYQLQLQLSSVL